ncbi:MAG: DUF4236 domain-containing protein [Candidatus Brocadiaceae bacterium]|nr:DUF4236 domain-containing protein [Candidatus Brocadiaceae bacterium]
MGFRFFRRVKIAPGVRLNIGKTGVTPSFGVRGARVTLGRKGARATVGLPGTGLSYTRVFGTKRAQRSRQAPKASPAPQPENKLDLNFFQRLTTPRSERAFVDGCKAYVAGDVDKASAELRSATHLADASFLAGFLAMQADRLEEAAEHLQRAETQHASLGRHFEKYGLQMELALSITEFLVAHVRPCRRGVLLGLAEVYQAQDRVEDALACLQRLRREAPEDVVVRASVVELMLEGAPGDKRRARQVLEIAGTVDNESSAHAALMLYKAQALRTLGLHAAARDQLTAAGRRRKDRDDELLRAIRYERACVYEDLGQAAQARREFEKLYAEDPSLEDVAERLGL